MVDTRNPNGTFGGPIYSGWYLPQLPDSIGRLQHSPVCRYLSAFNVTVVPKGSLGYLTIWPTGENQPLVSTMNSLDGRVKAKCRDCVCGSEWGSECLCKSDTTDVVIDVDGYFTTPGVQTLQFYPLTPCRVLDTRNPNGDLGGPYLQGEQQRNFPLLESSCIPQGVTPQAYSLNFTVVPYQGQPLSVSNSVADGPVTTARFRP